MGTTLIAFALRWLILALAVWVAAAVVPGIRTAGWESTLAVALALGILNAFVKPLVFLVTLPITVLTLGLFLIVINTGLLLLADWAVGALTDFRFEIDGFWSAVLGAIIISVVTFLVTRVFRPERIARNLTR